MQGEAKSMRVLVCGGGVIGACVAYFLARRGVRPLIIERTAVACAASGKSGGFLALDWCDGTPLQDLARRSFALHAVLPEEIGAAWGYRRMTTYGGFVAAGTLRPPAVHAPPREWLAADVTLTRRLGTAETTAQINPGEFTAAVVRAAQAHGAELRLGNVTGMACRQDGGMRGVEVDGEIIEGDAVVVAMGPWSILAARWMRLPGVFGLKGHSLVFATGARLPPEALFLEYQEA